VGAGRVEGRTATPTTGREPVMATTQSPLAPTAKQLAFLRRLAHQTGTTFTLPRTRRHASGQIAALVKRPVSEQLEFALDDLAVRGGQLAEAA